VNDDDPRSTRPARSERRRQRDRPPRDVHRAILDAAGALFAERGFERFSLRQVAERVGYTPTTIYLYFADKEELLFEVAGEGFAQFGARLQAAYDGAEGPTARLEAIGRAYIDFGLERPVHYRLMFMERPEFLSRPRTAQGGATIDSFGVLFRTVEELQAAGYAADGDPRTVAQLLWSGVHGIVALAISMPDCDDIQARRLADLYLPAIARGLGA
jgi:AcrR family transcriptional regulator